MLRRNEEKKIWMPTMISAAASTARRSSESAPNPRSTQMPTITAATTQPGEHDRAAEQQAVLEPEAGPHAVEPGVLLAHEVGAVRVGAQAERQHLRPDDHQQRAGDHRVQVPLAPEHLDLEQHRQRDERAEQRHHGARER